MSEHIDKIKAALAAPWDSGAFWAVCDRHSVGLLLAELEAAKADASGLRYTIKRCAATMRGEGVNDQGEAWDKTLRLLDAAMQGEKP
jgi:hypothetical protein